MTPEEGLHVLPPDVAGARYGTPRLAPWPGFALAAAAAVQQLEQRLGLDLWLVTHVEDDRQVVVASAGAWSDLAAPGTAFSWGESFCRRMVGGEGPAIAADVQRVPAYASVAVGVLSRVQAYVGVPLEDDEGAVVGTLCAYAGRAQDDALDDGLGLVQMVGQMLSTILSRERLARRRSEDAAEAYALVDRDRLTGLRNRRGWEAELSQEDERCRRYGSTASVLSIGLDQARSAPVGEDPDGTASEERLELCARVLAATSRPGDAQARTDEREFAVLAVECDALSARALLARLRVQLRAAGVVVSAGWATRRVGEDLGQAWARAEQAQHRDAERRQGLHPLAG